MTATPAADTERLQNRLAALEAASQRVSPRSFPHVFVSLSVRGWTATAVLRAAEIVKADGPTPDAAIDALAALLAERDPAVGWATLGVLDAGAGAGR
jgi:hypothetical protein